MTEPQLDQQQTETTPEVEVHKPVPTGSEVYTAHRAALGRLVGPPVQRSGGGDPDPLGGAAIPAQTRAALARRSGSGRPLAPDVARTMGEAMGSDFRDVRIHADGEADEISRSVQARAFTQGNDIYFTNNTFSPGTDAGDRLLAHELTHVVQQRHGDPGGRGTIGRADDPAETEADRVAGQVSGALRRRTATGPDALAPTWTPDRLNAMRRSTVARTPLGSPVIRRDDDPAPVTTPTTSPTTTTADTGTPSTGTPATGTEAEVPAAKTPAQKFEDALVPATAPANNEEGQTRMNALRLVLNGMTTAERLTISKDKPLMAKGRTHVGDLAYMGLLAAVGMKADKKKSDGGTEATHHMSGAEADVFITTNIATHPHLKPFIDTAVGAGKKADGYIATVDDADWEIAVKAQYNVEASAKASTNAFVGNKNADRPAILKADRGTISTAIHESMHRYSVLSVLSTFGSGLNEGFTEYFTRKIANADGTPASTTGPERTNYNSNIAFVRKLLRILGSDLTAQETTMAKIYYSGEVDLLSAKFTAAWKAKQTDITDADVSTKWTTFKSKVKAEDWTAALAALPAE